MAEQKNSGYKNQTCQNQQPPNYDKVKEIVMETLIELNLVPKAQKKKAIETA
jgi:hypothetical protein